jgi:hypothetical protein
MSASERPRNSTRLIALIAAAVVIAAVLVVIAVVTLRSGNGISAALEDEDFASCVERQSGAGDEPSIPDAGSRSEDDERRFWSQPIPLHCASVTLVEERRARALAIAFPSIEDGGVDELTQQWQPIADYATWLAEDDVPRDIAMMRITGVLRGLWIARSDEGRWAEGFTTTAVLADMRARDELPQFDDWLEDSETEGGALDLLTYRGDVLEKAGDETERVYREYLDRSQALDDVVR